MIVNKEDLKHNFIICYVCGKVLEEGQSYEKIITHSKAEITVHTNCIKKGCE